MKLSRPHLLRILEDHHYGNLGGRTDWELARAVDRLERISGDIRKLLAQRAEQEKLRDTRLA